MQKGKIVMKLVEMTAEESCNKKFSPVDFQHEIINTKLSELTNLTSFCSSSSPVWLLLTTSSGDFGLDEFSCGRFSFFAFVFSIPVKGYNPVLKINKNGKYKYRGDNPVKKTNKNWRLKT